jgi:hypothetical protein
MMNEQARARLDGPNDTPDDEMLAGLARALEEIKQTNPAEYQRIVKELEKKKADAQLRMPGGEIMKDSGLQSGEKEEVWFFLNCYL